MGEVFETTVWSRIQAVQRKDTRAVDDFVGQYRPALLRYLQLWGFSPHDAEDLAQETLARLLAEEALSAADRSRGRFRNFLLGVAKNVAREERARRAALKRGGGASAVPFTDELPVAAPEPQDGSFDLVWVEHVIRRALAKLQEENPRQQELLVLKFEKQLSNEEISKRTGRDPKQVKNDVHRGRERLARLIKNEIALYASSNEEYEAELQAFVGFIGNG